MSRTFSPHSPWADPIERSHAQHAAPPRPGRSGHLSRWLGLLILTVSAAWSAWWISDQAGLEKYAGVVGTFTVRPTLIPKRGGWQPRCEYTYTVNGRSLTGRAVTPGDVRFQNEPRALLVLQQVETTANLVVWHDPAHPEIAVLYPHPIADAWLGPSSVLALGGLFGAAVLLVGTLNRAPRNPTLPVRTLAGLALMILQLPATLAILRASEKNRFVECGIMIAVLWSLGVVLFLWGLTRAPRAQR